MRKLFISIILLSFFLSFSPAKNQNVRAETAYQYLAETFSSPVSMYSGADPSYKMVSVIPSRTKLLVLSETTNAAGHWYKVSNGDKTGWISANGVHEETIDGTFLVSINGTIVRRGADESYGQTAVLEKGQLAIVKKGFTGRDGEKWAYINAGKKSGWIKLTEESLFDPGRKDLSKGIFVHAKTSMKTSASVESGSAASLNANQLVTIHNILVSGSEKWYRVSSGKNTGWIQASKTSNLVKTSRTFYGKNEGSPLRRSASSSDKISTTLAPGTKAAASHMFVNDKNEIWYKVTLENGKSGWAQDSDLTTQKLKVAYLTVDDGPTVYTAEMLNILDRYNAKATFFMIDGNMKAHSSDVKRMVEDGHAVGSHSVTHNKNILYRAPKNVVSEMEQCRTTIRRITGMTSNLMRVPYGSKPYMTRPFRDAVNKNGFIMWDWTVDSLDWKYQNSQYVTHSINQIKSDERNGRAPVILIHDKATTVRHLPALLDYLKKQGYVLLPLTESIKPHQFPL